MIVGYLSEYVHGKQLGYVHDKEFLVDGFNHLEKYEFVSWDGWHPIYEMDNKTDVPNHQPVINHYQPLLTTINHH